MITRLVILLTLWTARQRLAFPGRLGGHPVLMGAAGLGLAVGLGVTLQSVHRANLARRPVYWATAYKTGVFRFVDQYL
jgi:hypothetical protein